MKKHLYFLSACLFAVLFSCSKEAPQFLDSNQPQSPQIIQSGSIICCPGIQSKTTYGLAEEGVFSVVWSAGDAVQVHSTDGLVSSEYTLVSGIGESEGIFSSSSPVSGNSRLAIYPSSADLGLDDSGNPVIDLSGLSNQSYSDDLAGNATNVTLFPLWARESNVEEGYFQFNNICGGLSLRLNDYQGFGMKITSVEIVSASMSISGRATLDTATGELTLSGTDAQKSIKMSYPEGKLICSTPASTTTQIECFYITLPAIEYPAGDLTFNITDDQGRVFSKTVNSVVKVNPGRAKKMSQLCITTYFGQANSVMVEPGESAVIDATPYYTFSNDYSYENCRVKGEGGVDYFYSEAVAEPLWELAAKAGTYASGSVLQSCYYEDGKIYVTAKDVKGNAVVALKDKNGTILWSFHVWVTDTPEDHSYTNVNGGVFQDRHLGATNTLVVDRSTESPNYDCLGLLYQNGRKDPFACSLKEYNVPLYNSENVNEINGNIAYTIQHPGTRLLNATAKYHWYIATTDASGEDLPFWGCTRKTSTYTIEEFNKEEDAPKTVYDPCPEGYRVPEAKYLYFVKDQNAIFNSASGYDMNYDGTNTNYWAPCGYLPNGNDIINASTYGFRAYRLYIWSASGNMNYTIRLFCISSAVKLDTDVKYGRAAALGVRCRKITSQEVTGLNIDSQLEEPIDE
ncbi:MAG: hypothetical protein ACOXZI_04615 [Candidatus Cryptobacteroides sp.]|jgi:hypothetical protein